MARTFSHWDSKGLFGGTDSAKQYFLVVVDNRSGGFRVRPLAARLTREELAVHVNTTPEGISVAVSAGLLKPCTEPGRKKQMYFPTQYTLDLLDDPALLARITECHQKAVEKKYKKAKKVNARAGNVERSSDVAKL